MRTKVCCNLDKMKNQLFCTTTDHPAKIVIREAFEYLRDNVGISEETLMFCLNLDEKQYWAAAKDEIAVQIKDKFFEGKIELKSIEPWRHLHDFKAKFSEISKDYTWRAALQFLTDVKNIVHLFN